MASSMIPTETIARKILLLRNRKVMLDRDLAELYGVKTKVLKQAVKRNIDRFPEDFMFVLTKDEFEDWRSQFVTSNQDKMGLRYKPMAFSELGVAMLSSILNSKRAIQINIQIMRAFVRINQILSTNKEVRHKIEEHDKKINALFDVVNQLLAIPEPKPKKYGFTTD
jgi:hypothetical protein